MEEGEWIWADSAYPLTKWCQAPYKKYHISCQSHYSSYDVFRPEKLQQRNGIHNYHVSAVHVRSEHCVGFLKGRWSSLRGLHIAITDEKSLHFATLWIIGCIHLHAFAMKHEEGQDMRRDTFY